MADYQLASSEDQPASNIAAPGRDIKSTGKHGGVYLSKPKLVIVGFVFVVLVILLLVFVILYGTTKAAREKGGPDGDSSKIQGQPTGSPPPTTPGTEAWWNVRLSRDVTPYHYNVLLDVSLEEKRFDGFVEIFIDVAKTTDTILVHGNKMEITTVSVARYGSGQLEVARRFWFEKNQFYVIILKKPFTPGKGDIKLRYKARLATDLMGLYYGSYKNPKGETVDYIGSQLQPTSARSVFPCFDEPGFKATFSVSITDDRPTYKTITNMPVKTASISSDKKRLVFQNTPKMSTYLLAFAVGDFGNTTVVTENKVKLTFYATPFQMNAFTYATYVGRKVLTFYEKYYGINYPLPKADMIALPDFMFGAMENWGLIAYRELALLWTQESSSAFDKQIVGELISHELAHQWFGNLVTMKWWDDLWLNEGFASYIWYLGLNNVEPTWQLLDQFIVNTMDVAMQMDGLASSHPIKVPVANPSQIGEVFDAISYNKGGCILRMLGDFLGSDVFVKGIKRYLEKHAYSNAETDDLWKALDEESCSRGSCANVKHVMDTWTLQMGYPVVTVMRMNSTHMVTSQRRFLFDQNVNASQSKYTSPYNYTWVIPFTYITDKHPVKRTLLDPTGFIPWDGSGWFKGNVGQKGYYVVNYEDVSMWDALITQLKTNHKVLSPADRAGLIIDVFVLARVGLVDYSTALLLTDYMRNEQDYAPWAALYKSINYIETKLPPTEPAYNNLKKYLVHLTKNIYNTIGFKDTGSHINKLLRNVILKIQCEAHVQACLDQAKTMYENWTKDPVKNSIPPNFRSLVYYHGIAQGGEKEWDMAFSRFRETKEATARKALLQGMAGARADWIVRRYLDYSMNPSKIKAQDTLTVIKQVVYHNPMGPQLAWDFVRLRWKEITIRFSDNSIFSTGVLIKAVTERFSNKYHLDQLIEYATEQKKGGIQVWQQAIENVRANMEWRRNYETKVAHWLSQYVKMNNL